MASQNKNQTLDDLSLPILLSLVKSGINKPNKENIEKILKTIRPGTKKCIQSFLGVTGYYRNFIPNYSSIQLLSRICYERDCQMR